MRGCVERIVSAGALGEAVGQHERRDEGEDDGENVPEVVAERGQELTIGTLLVGVVASHGASSAKNGRSTIADSAVFV